eukprot:scaffold20820_cov90-Isochrysis_galbana.AAC.1
MRTVHDQPLDQHAGDLLLQRLVARLGEEEQQQAGEVVGVVVGVAELVGQPVEEEVPALGRELGRDAGQAFDGRGAVQRRRRREAVRDGVHPHVQHERVDDSDAEGAVGCGQAGPEVVQQRGRAARLEESVEWFQHAGGRQGGSVGRQDGGWLRDLGEEVDLRPRAEGR